MVWRSDVISHSFLPFLPPSPVLSFSLQGGAESKVELVGPVQSNRIAAHLCYWVSNLQNRDEWAQKEGKLWEARVDVHKCQGLVEMKASCHLWRKGLPISPLSISPGGEEG